MHTIVIGYVIFTLELGGGIGQCNATIVSTIRFWKFDYSMRAALYVNLCCYSLYIVVQLCIYTRTTYVQWSLFQWNPELLGRQIGQINSGAFGVFSAQIWAPILVKWVPCPCFSLFNHYFYKKTRPLFPHPKKLFEIRVWIWAAKNYGFILRVSIVHESK